MGIETQFWKNKVVFITGHNGFKGGWLSLILDHFGAEVHGYSLEPDSDSIFYKSTLLENRLRTNTVGNINDLLSLDNNIRRVSPEIIFHLAAQPLVKESYENPLKTYNTNIIGTANLLEISKSISSIKSIVNVTTDKCYKNNEWERSYHENDSLGGYDPYSSSKACSELISDAYRNSFLNELNIQLATARAGNVIGGGDWSNDRLLPDIVKNLKKNNDIVLRNPQSIRPWQHVLEPITGYLMLAQKMYQQTNKYNSAWNFGPEESDCISVKEVAEIVVNVIGRGKIIISNENKFHESNLLKLDNSKSRKHLGWKPKWTVKRAIEETIFWYQAFEQGSENMYNFSIEQLQTYLKNHE